MCGIVGAIGASNAAEIILTGLKRLEYRGYDSAGIATLDGGAITRQRAEGKLINLQNRLEQHPLQGGIGIGHTRWATHGVPNETNAHPHATARVAVVHNGIIENYQELRAELQAKGYSFLSQTDTEVVPVMVTRYLDEGMAPKDAVQATLDRLHGAFSLGILITDSPDALFCARRGAPLCLGLGEGSNFFASDPMALAGRTSRICYLEEGDWACVRADAVQVFDRTHQPVDRPTTIVQIADGSVGKGNYRHYMLKEIHEQPGVLGSAFGNYINALDKTVHLPDVGFNATDIRFITMIACGTSYYAANVAKYWMEDTLGVPVVLDIASEFRYRTPYFAQGGLVICISQSGETADTLAALRMAKEAGQHTLAIVNVPASTMAREAHGSMQIFAGPEIGVASTKAFTAQLATLACLTLGMAKQRNAALDIAPLLHALTETPARMLEALHHESAYEAIAQSLMKARDVLYIGRGTSFPLAMEGALKLKEISYIHAEGYAAGELKHGPIALIDEHVPIIALAPHDVWFDKTLSNIQEAAARGGNIIAITDEAGAARLKDIAQHVIVMPQVHAIAAPLLYALPVQLLAYYVAVAKGTDVDQPRNLAKSVTVE